MECPQNETPPLGARGALADLLALALVVVLLAEPPVPEPPGEHGGVLEREAKRKATLGGTLQKGRPEWKKGVALSVTPKHTRLWRIPQF